GAPGASRTLALSSTFPECGCGEAGGTGMRLSAKSSQDDVDRIVFYEDRVEPEVTAAVGEGLAGEEIELPAVPWAGEYLPCPAPPHGGTPRGGRGGGPPRGARRRPAPTDAGRHCGPPRTCR